MKSEVRDGRGGWWSAWLLGWCCFLVPAMLVAAPFAKRVRFVQPDGTRIELWGQGDDFWAVFETLDGYTVIFDPATRAYQFARLSVDGRDLVSTGVEAHRVSGASLGLTPHLRPTVGAVREKAMARYQDWDRAVRLTKRWNELKAGRRTALAGVSGIEAAPPSAPTVGKRVGVTVLIDFSDAPGTIPQSSVRSFLNDDNYTGYGNNGSVKEYFEDNSGGLLIYTNAVTIYIRMAQPKTYYNNTGVDCGTQGVKLIKDAMAILKARADYASTILPTFSELSTDASGWVLACNVFFAGDDSGVWARGLWPHSWILNDGGAVTPVPLGNGKSLANYQITNLGTSLELGTFCHENGHMLCGFPDIYDYDYDSVGGAGSFCLMDYGGHGSNPVMICGYLRRAAGWVTTTELDDISLLTGTLVAAPNAAFNQLYRFARPGVATEYFLMENRQRIGRDSALPAAGIAVWHVDELGDRDDQSLTPNALHHNYELTLVQADGAWDFEFNRDYGDAQDLYFLDNTAVGYSNELADSTSPNTRWWDGSASGLRLHDFSASGATMTFKVGDGADTVVRVNATTATAAEPATKGVLTFTRSGSTTDALTVYYTVSGTATAGSDYTSLGTSVTIPAGSATVTKDVVPTDDATAETSETIIVTLAANAAYSVSASPNDHATVTLIDDDTAVSVAATDATATEPSDRGTFTFTRTGPTTVALPVNFSVSGTATAGSDYTSLGTSVTIPVGSATVTKDVVPIDDTTAEGPETVVVTMAAGVGYVPAPTPANTATVTLGDNDVQVSVVASDATAGEPADKGTFTFTRTGGTAFPLTVNFTVSGSATAGTDYTSLGTSVTIPVGSASVTKDVVPIDDSTAELNKTIAVTLTSGSGYTSAASPNNTATVLLVDDETLVSIRTSTSTAREPAEKGGFIFSRVGSTNAALTVNFVVTGTATPGTDYTSLGTSVTIPAGATSVTKDVVPIDDTTAEVNETVIVTLAAGTGYSVAASPNNASTVTLMDDEVLVSIRTGVSNAREPAEKGSFQFVRVGGTNTPVTINFTVSGTATPGVDYAGLGTSVTIPAGEYSVTKDVVPIDDTTAEVNETVIVTLAAGTGYTVAPSPSNVSTVTLMDDEVLVNVRTGISTAREPAEKGSFQFVRVGGTNTPVTINFTVSGTATAGTDYANLGTSVTIPAGEYSVTKDVVPIDDTTAEVNETVIVTLAAGTGYTVAASPNNVSTVTLVDDEVLVSVRASDSAAGEPADRGTFQFTRVGGTNTPVTINFTVSGTATAGTDYASLGTSVTIPAGEYSVTKDVVPIDDTTAEANETVIVTLATGIGYTVAASPNNVATVTIAEDEMTVSVRASDSAAGEPADKGTFLFSRTGSTTGALVVNFTVSGTATAGTDYTSLGTTVTIPAGSTSATLDVVPIDDTTAEVNETVIVTLAASSAYTIAASPNNVATVTIAEDEMTVSVRASDSAAGEPADKGSFLFSRTGSTTAALVVNFTVSGTATPGSDYTSLGTTVTIPAGATSATLDVVPIDDTIAEVNETVIVTLAASSAYTIAASPNNVATVTIAEDEMTVSVRASDSAAGEPADKGTFLFSRTGSTNAALVVNFTVSGTATPGTDYTSLGTTVTIPAGATSVTKDVVPIDDTTAEVNETVIVTLAASSAYTVAASPNNVATVTIAEDEMTVSVRASDSAAGEPADKGTFLFSRTGSTTAALVVNFTVSGTATPGSDYTSLGTTVTIPAGSTSATLDVVPIDDTLAEVNETVIVTLAASSAYTIATSPNNVATVTIAEDEMTVSVRASDSAAGEPADKGTFLFSRTGSTNAALVVNFTVSGTATPGTDYTSLGTTVTIPAGATSVTKDVVPIDDTTAEANETVIVTLAASSAYTIAASPNNVATVTIAEDEMTVSVRASDSVAGEPADKGTFLFSRTGSITAALVVNFTVSGTATPGSDYTSLGTTVTIPAGSTSTTLDVVPIDDTLAEVNETVIVTLAASSAYTIAASPNNVATVTIAEDEMTISVRATDPFAGEPADKGTFLFSRTGSTNAALVVNFTVGGTATPGTDYTSLGTTVTIPAGATSVTKDVVPIDDTTAEANETVIVTLAASSAYTIAASPNNVATVTIAEDEMTVSVRASDSAASEPADKGTFLFSRTGSTNSALVVYFTVSGTATAGTDYASLGTTVTIPAGANSVTKDVVPIDDGTPESSESVIVTLVASSAYTVAATPNNAATVSIADDEVVVGITSPDPNASEAGLTPGTLMFRRRGPLTAAVTVNFTVAGTATSGTDYVALGNTVTIPAGKDRVVVSVTPLADSLPEPDETVIVTLATGAGYVVGTEPENSTTIKIMDKDLPKVSVIASDPTASEAGLGRGAFTFLRKGSTSVALTVDIVLGGSARSGSDYLDLGTTVTFPAGASMVTVPVVPVDDAIAEPVEVLILNINGGTGYVVENPGTASILITDDD